MIAIITMAIFSAEAPDIAGIWKASLETTFQPGPALDGRVKAGEYEAPIEKAKLEGDKIQFEINIQPGKRDLRGKGGR